MSRWKPIETAPKDDVILLFGKVIYTESRQPLHIPGKKRIAGYWDDVYGGWCSMCSTWEGPWVEPTHWMPLPSPPEGDG